jgi:hypothetical protein
MQYICKVNKAQNKKQNDMKTLTQHPKKNDVLSNGDVIKSIKKTQIKSYDADGTYKYVSAFFLCILTKSNNERISRYFPLTMEVSNYEKAFNGATKGTFFKTWSCI